MPGHKGKGCLGVETLDITEIDGADELFAPGGIIAESEANASRIFGAETLYSAGGSTLCIQAMLYLISQYAAERGTPPRILAGRNAHKAFVNAAALLDIDIDWIFPQKGPYHSCAVTPQELENELRRSQPTAVYVTSPDYLGNILDIAGLAAVCRSFGVILAVDNAHGAYLKFLPEPRHPIALGADICCDSAHKTLSVITGGAYLHISLNAPAIFSRRAKAAFSVFGSSSPSYLILQSLDAANAKADFFRARIAALVPRVKALKDALLNHGFGIAGNEPLKVTVSTKKFGYRGEEIAEILEAKNIYPEFYDSDFVVFMISAESGDADIARLEGALLSIPPRAELCEPPPPVPRPKKVISPREAVLRCAEKVAVDSAEGRICAQAHIGCPPAIPLIVCGERIDREVIENLKYYKKEYIDCCAER